MMMMKTIYTFILLIALSTQPSIFLVADSDLAVDDTQKIENKGTTSNDAKDNTDDNNIGDNQPNLPEALVHAARVGAKMRAAQAVQHNSPDNINNEDNEADDDEHSREPKPPLASGCFGTMGCKKVSPNKHKNEEDQVSTTIHEENTDNATTESVGDTTSSKVMGRDWKDRGPSIRKQTKYTDVGDEELAHNAPLGFKLDGRVVTSPSDGLSYFLDAPKDNARTIPYSYLECGPTIESSTEAFSTLDMVLRHLPASAQSVSHWANLGGGITIESSLDDGEEEVDDTTRYIDTDGDVEPRPILVIALSPIEITVSGNNEESRVYQPGSVILMEDTVGKGHKIKAAVPVNNSAAESSNTQQPESSKDMSLLMVTLPHNIHFPIDWHEDPSLLHNNKDIVEESSTTTDVENGLTHGLFAPKDIHQERRLRRKQTSSFVTASMKKPCPLEYDSAASLFEPTNNQYKHRRSSSISAYPAKQDAKLFRFLPSLRRTMLVGIGLSLTSSFMYCVQLLYPPLLVLWGGATMILGGALLNILATRYGYRRFAADWEEEWRWKIEVRRNRLHREELKQQQQEEVDTTLQQSDEKEAESVIKVHTSEDIELEVEAKVSMEES